MLLIVVLICSRGEFAQASRMAADVPGMLGSGSPWLRELDARAGPYG
jgi:hypothetical protein